MINIHLIGKCAKTLCGGEQNESILRIELRIVKTIKQNLVYNPMVKQFGLPSYVIWLFAGLAFVVVGLISVFHWTYGLATFILSSGVAFAGYWFFFRPAFVAMDIVRSGEPAMAIILHVTETGRTVNHHPRIKLVLEIRHSTMVPYEVELLQNIPREELRNYQPGRTLQVKVDSRDPKKVAILAA